MKNVDVLARMANAFGAVAGLAFLALIVDFGVHLWTAYHGRVNTSSIFGG